MFSKIISGGQTGVDRAALDFALANRIEHGGWCPRGRRAEDGVLNEKYTLHETPRKDYRQRTRWNVRDSDGTLIIVNHELSGGTRYTFEVARKLKKPVMMVDTGGQGKDDEVLDWLEENDVQVLNVAGPRSSSEPEIYTMTRNLLDAVYRSR
ncbi:MAG: putative molybdenum carrier protein [Chlorobiales bacterium]|nr:putative molybdenum carrier protein [Chlorobiales bacterium]